MKKLSILAILAAFLIPSWALATNYFGCAAVASANINVANGWGTASTGSCTCSGANSTMPTFTSSDNLYANGCASIAINVDPGSVSATPTLRTDVNGTGATAGGGFTLCTATTTGCLGNSTSFPSTTAHFNTQAGTTHAVSISGSSGGGTIFGNGISSSTTNSVDAISDNVSGSTPMTFTGSYTSGTGGTSDYGIQFSSSGTPVTINGNCIGASGPGCYFSPGGASLTVNGNCVGSSTTNNGQNPGCRNNSTSALTITGNLIWGTDGPPITGPFLWTPASTNYVLAPATGSYTAGTLNANATEAGPVYDSTNTTYNNSYIGPTNIQTTKTAGSVTGSLSSSGGASVY
jgi:hypothetical protein